MFISPDGELTLEGALDETVLLVLWLSEDMQLPTGQILTVLTPLGAPFSIPSTA